MNKKVAISDLSNDEIRVLAIIADLNTGSYASREDIHSRVQIPGMRFGLVLRSLWKKRLIDGMESLISVEERGWDLIAENESRFMSAVSDTNSP